jgi:hypothetical protein
MRLPADMGVSWRVVEWLRSIGHDAVHFIGQGTGTIARFRNLRDGREGTAGATDVRSRLRRDCCAVGKATTECDRFPAAERSSCERHCPTQIRAVDRYDFSHAGPFGHHAASGLRICLIDGSEEVLTVTDGAGQLDGEARQVRRLLGLTELATD